MMARRCSLPTLSDEDEPTKKAHLFLAAYAREVEEDLVTDVRDVHTLPMARPPVRGLCPASGPPEALQPRQPVAPQARHSGVVRCLTPLSMAVQLDAFRATPANEVTPESTRPAPSTSRARVCHAFAAGVLAGASLFGLYTIGQEAPALIDEAPHVVVGSRVSFAHDDVARITKHTTPRAAARSPTAHLVWPSPVAATALPLPLPLPPPPRGLRAPIVRLPPF